MMSDDDDGYVDFEEFKRRRAQGRGAHVFRVSRAEFLPLLPTPVAALAPRRWIYGRRMLRGAASMLIAPPGQGKSMMTLQDALCISTGRRAMGFDVHEPGPVWVYNAEEPQEELDRRLHAAMQMMGIGESEIEGVLCVQSGRREPWDLAWEDEDGNVIVNEELVESITDQCRHLDIAALYADPLIKLHGCDENSNESMDALAGIFGRIAEEGECAVCFVQHTPKTAYNSDSAGRLEAGRGAGALGASVRIAETLYTMSPKDAERLGIDDANRRAYRRLDDAKGSYSAADSECWFRFEAVELANGDEVGVLTLAEMDQAKAERASAEREVRQTIAKRLIPITEQANGSAVTFNEACRLLAQQIDGPFRDFRDAVTGSAVSRKVRRKVEEAIKNHEPVNGMRIEIFEAPGPPPHHGRTIKWVRLGGVGTDEEEIVDLF